MLYLTYKIMWVMCMIKKQETMILSEYTGIYDLVVPKDNMLRKINELIDFSFVYDELLDKYCINNGRNAIDPTDLRTVNNHIIGNTFFRKKLF